MEGYLSKESWANVGFATPEAALQTTLWAIRQGDLAQVAECMEPRSRDMLRQIQERDPAERARMLEGWQPLIQPAGLRIAEPIYNWFRSRCSYSRLGRSSGCFWRCSRSDRLGGRLCTSGCSLAKEIRRSSWCGGGGLVFLI